jgi:hypothetical protein
MHQNATVAAILKMKTLDRWFIAVLQPPDKNQAGTT